MNARSRLYGIQEKLDLLTKRWLCYVLLLLLFFIPAQAAKDFDPRESLDLIGQVLSNPLIYALPVLMPIAKLIPVGLIIGVLVFGNRWRRVFNVYVAILYLALAVFQTTAVTQRYGLVVITGNLVLVLIVGLMWVWEVFSVKNDFTPRKRQWQQWWVAPVAAMALLAPVNAGTMTPDFNPVRMGLNEAGLTCCMMTPVVLAVLLLFYPTINVSVLRITSFAGILLGAVNMIVWFVIERWGWWMGIMHIPLVILSIYGFVLGQLPARKSPPVTAMPPER